MPLEQAKAVTGGTPKSCRRVIGVLNSLSAGVSQKEIAERTGLSLRSVKASVKLLLLYNQISEFSLITDMRRKIYRRGDENGVR